MALTRLEEVAVPVILLGQTGSDEPREVRVSLDQMVILEPGILASREDRNICRYVSAVTPGAAQVVLGGNVSFQIPADTRVMITKICFGVNTVSDNCVFELGYTNQAGAFTPAMMEFYVATGATPDGRQTFSHDFYPPLPLTYSEVNLRGITFRVNANDAACQISCGWFGWHEPVE